MVPSTDPMVTISVLALVVQVVAFAGGLVYVSARVRVTVDNLTSAITALTRTVEHLDEKLDGHGDRLTRLETRVDGWDGSDRRRHVR